jgi:hypothetical protein
MGIVAPRVRKSHTLPRRMGGLRSGLRRRAPRRTAAWGIYAGAPRPALNPVPNRRTLWEKFEDDREMIGLKVVLLTSLAVLVAALSG